MIEQITAIAGLCLTVITTVIGSICTIKKGKKLKHTNEILELAKIVKKIPEYIIEAEKMFASEEMKFGPQKLSYVLKEIQLECIQKSIEFDKEAFTYEIEKILETPQKKETVE